MNRTSPSIFIIFAFCLLASLASCQRGRMSPPGRGAGHPPPGASSSDPNQDLLQSSSQGKCKIVNGVNTCSPSSNQSSSYRFNYLIISMVLMVIGFVYMKKREIWVLKDIYKKEMKSFQQKVLSVPYKPREIDLNNKILAFQNTNFKMDDLRKDKIEHYKCQMKIVNIEKVKDRIYEIKYQCQDINGESTLQGLVGIISKNQFGVKLVKVYKKFTPMGERTKKIKNLMFYEGKGTLKELNGEWHFIGYEDTETHSGTWKMIAI